MDLIDKHNINDCNIIMDNVNSSLDGIEELLNIYCSKREDILDKNYIKPTNDDIRLVIRLDKIRSKILTTRG